MRYNKNLRNEVWKVKYGEVKKKNWNRFERERIKYSSGANTKGNKNKNTLKCSKEKSEEVVEMVKFGKVK